MLKLLLRKRFYVLLIMSFIFILLVEKAIKIRRFFHKADHKRNVGSKNKHKSNEEMSTTSLRLSTTRVEKSVDYEILMQRPAYNPSKIGFDGTPVVFENLSDEERALQNAIFGKNRFHIDFLV